MCGNVNLYLCSTHSTMASSRWNKLVCDRSRSCKDRSLCPSAQSYSRLCWTVRLYSSWKCTNRNYVGSDRGPQGDSNLYQRTSYESSRHVDTLTIRGSMKTITRRNNTRISTTVKRSHQPIRVRWTWLNCGDFTSTGELAVNIESITWSLGCSTAWTQFYTLQRFRPLCSKIYILFSLQVSN